MLVNLTNSNLGMKPVKRILLFLISLVTFSACFNPPEFDDSPSIEFKSIEFKDRGNAARDSLIFTISFKDGNGDLGLDGEISEDIDPPFHDKNFFLAKDNGELVQVEKKLRYTNFSQFLDVPAGANPGKLVTVRTRDNPLFSSLPSYFDPLGCTFYSYDTILVSGEHKSVFDKTYTVIDSFKNNTQPTIYVLLDTFYYKQNPNHLNIEVDWLVKQSNNTYEEYDWIKEQCNADDFSERFPRLSDKNGPLEGDITYALTSRGIRAIFQNRTIKLRITIKDRALNVSNTVESCDFTLDRGCF